MSQRMSQYDGLSPLQYLVARAIHDGYIITHKGLLLWGSIPTAKDVDLLRCLFLLLEATFTNVFWVAKRKGLCSHSALKEGVDVLLTAKELEELAAMRRGNENTRKLPQNAAQPTFGFTTQNPLVDVASRSRLCQYVNVNYIARHQSSFGLQSYASTFCWLDCLLPPGQPLLHRSSRTTT